LRRLTESTGEHVAGFASIRMDAISLWRLAEAELHRRLLCLGRA